MTGQERGSLRRTWVEPLTVWRNERVGLLGTPCARLVLVKRGCSIIQNWIDDAPGLFDIILTRKTNRISPHRVKQKLLVSAHLRGIGLFADNQFDVLSFRLVARFLYRGADGNH